MSVYTNKGYKFTIVNGSVTAVYEIEKGRAKFEKMDSNETWSFDGSNVIKTEFEHGHTEITMFSDIDGDGIFNKVSKSYAADTSSKSQTVFTTTITPQKNGYQFDIVDGSVTAVYEIERGYKSQERIDLNETWSIDGSNIIKTEIERGITETTTYADIDGDGVFAKISKSYVSSDGSIWSGKSGTDNDDVWKGNNSDDLYYAGNGNDRLTGGFGSDDLYGADGDDQLFGESGSDDLYGGIGNDILTGGDGVDHLEGGLDNDKLDGGIGDDYLNGGSGVDALTGGVGNDDLYGEDGNDILTGGDGVDHLEGGLDNDKLDGGIGDDYLNGGSGVDALTGGIGNDDLYGENGNDILTGGIGSDNLYGGLGDDYFKFTTVYESGLTSTTRDHILDFTNGDKIDLSAIDAKAGNRTNDSFMYIGTSSSLNLNNANGAIWFENGTIYGSNDRDIAAEFQIELIGVTNISVADLVL